MAEQKIVPYPAVNAAIFDANGRVLLTRRSQTIREPGKWCLPGGHLDGGEDWRTAIRREIREETGLIVKKETLIGIYSDPALTVTEQVIRDGSHYGQFLVTLFGVQEFEGDISPNHEVDAWEWFERGRLPTPIIKSHPIRVDDAFGFQGQVFVR